MRYIMSSKEYDAVDKVLTASKMSDAFGVYQTPKRGDCFMDFENNNHLVSLKTGLTWLFEGFENQGNLYKFSKQKTIKSLA